MAPRAKKPTALSDDLSRIAGALGYRDGPLVGQLVGGYAKDYANLYRTSWIAQQAIERKPEDCFRKGYAWTGYPKQVALIDAVESRHKIKEKKKRAMTLARRDGEAFLYMDTGAEPSEELDVTREGRDSLQFVNLFTIGKLRKGPLVKDPLSEYYGEPEYYRISQGAASGEVRIHPSRVIRFVNDPEPDTGAGVPVLARLAQVICNAETARDNASALTTQARLHVIKTGLLAAVEAGLDQDVVKRFQLFSQMIETNGLAVLDKEGEDYANSQTTFTGLPDIIETMRREVAAALEIPHALLFGRDGGLGTNGEMELETYYGTISAMQVSDIQNTCAPLDELLVRSALGNKPDDVFIEWRPLWEASAKEKAEVGKITADTAVALVTSNVVPAEVLTESVISSLEDNGSMPGLSGAYQNWLAAGGVDDVSEEDVDVLRPAATTDSILDEARELLKR